MNQDDDAPASEEEQREATDLAASLDQRARAPELLPPGLEAAVMDRVAPLLDARRADDRRRRRRRATLVSLGGLAAAAAFALLVSTQRLSAPRGPVATAPPAPPADLLAIQARVARGGGAALAALDVEMRSYRRNYHDQLLRRRGGGAP